MLHMFISVAIPHLLQLLRVHILSNVKKIYENQQQKY